MERMILTVGRIEPSSTQEIVVVGDPEAGQTIEADFLVEGAIIAGFGFDFSYDTTALDWFAKDSPVFKTLSELVGKQLDRPAPSAYLMGRAWALLQWELEEVVPELLVVGDEASGGEFTNPGQAYNGQYYLRYYVAEGAEIYGEQIIVLLTEPAT